MQVSKEYCYSGIYCIVNIKNKNKYIGSSKNIYSRLQKHFALLRHNKHENSHLQNAWNKYKEEYFDFYVLEQCSEETLEEREQFYIDTLKPAYNITKQVERLVMSNESRRKMSKTRKERISSGQIKCYQCVPLHQYDLEGNYIASYASIKEACKSLSIHRSTILRYLKGTYKKGGNYLWSLEKVDKMLPYIKDTWDHSKLFKPIKMEWEDNIRIFKSIGECAEYFGVTPACIHHALRNSGIYRYKYKLSFYTAVLGSNS